MQHISFSNLLANLALDLTNSQKDCLEQFVAYMEDPNPYGVFLLKGYAGTGKTFLLNLIAQVCSEAGMSIELMASTGRAAQQLSGSTGRAAHTIHRRIYRSSSAMPEQGGSYQLSGNARASSLVIVDEASMISGNSQEASPFGSGNLLDDLLAFVWQAEGAKLILVGDAAQLPPVGTSLSDALNPDVLTTRYGLSVYTSELTEVVRQGRESSILALATELRSLLQEYEEADDEDELPLELHLKDKDPKEIQIITGAEIIDTLDSAYREWGQEGSIVITPSNKRALTFNLGIRSQVLDYDEQIVRGDRLIVARNNYHYAEQRDRSDFIANGELVEVIRLHKYREMYDLHFVDATILLPDRGREVEARLLLSGLGEEQPQRTTQQRENLFAQIALDYEHITSVTERRRQMRKDPYWGALEVKYGYAITAHKAQGGQWPCVFIDLGLLGYLPTDKNMIRWLYTAVTRATHRLYLINIPEEFLAQ